MKVCGEEKAGDSDRWGLSAPSSLCSLWYYMRWQCCHVTGMHPVFPAERSRMLLMLIGSFSQQAPPCAPASNKRPCCLLRLINQTNATGGTKHVCKCTWAFLTCLAVYMAEGFRGVHAFVCVCVWLRANVLYGRCQRMARVNSTTKFSFFTQLVAVPALCVAALQRSVMDWAVLSLASVLQCRSGTKIDEMRWRKPLPLLSVEKRKKKKRLCMLVQYHRSTLIHELLEDYRSDDPNHLN